MTATNSFGCYQEAYSNIHVKDIQTVFFPNAFSPDGMGPSINNKFFASGRGIKSIDLSIFNKWGQPIYHEIGDSKVSWDGNCSGKAMVNGIYFYSAIIEFSNGKTREITGTVHLLR
jgi:gliding motility-associated-like protein